MSDENAQTPDADMEAALREMTEPARRKAERDRARREQEEAYAADYLRKPDAPDTTLKPGTTPSLHVLNARAKAERAEKNAVRAAAAKAAAEAVNKTLIKGGVTPRRATPTKPAGPNTAAIMANQGGED
jgi:hypothetical protein